MEDGVNLKDLIKLLFRLPLDTNNKDYFIVNI